MLIKHFSISHKLPASQDFTLRSDGGFVLSRLLNYNVARNYNYTVRAQVGDDITTVYHLLLVFLLSIIQCGPHKAVSSLVQWSVTIVTIPCPISPLTDHFISG